MESKAWYFVKYENGVKVYTLPKSAPARSKTVEDFGIVTGMKVCGKNEDILVSLFFVFFFFNLV